MLSATNSSTAIDKSIPQQGPMLYRVKDFADVTSLSKTTIYDLINAGQIKTVKIGRSTRITRGELERFITTLENEA